MSIGGCYVSLKKDVLQKIQEENLSLEKYVFNNDNDVLFCSLEQYWDALRVLFEQINCEILGDMPIESDLGEMALEINVKAIYPLLKDITNEKITELFYSKEYQSAEFYWDNIFKNEDELSSILDLKEKIINFFENSINNNREVIFYMT